MINQRCPTHEEVLNILSWNVCCGVDLLISLPELPSSENPRRTSPLLHYLEVVVFPAHVSIWSLYNQVPKLLIKYGSMSLCMICHFRFMRKR